MTLDKFYNDLENAIKDNKIDLGKVSETQPFVKYLQMDSLTVTSVTLKRTDIDVTLTGTATFLNVTNDVTLTGNLDSEGNLLITLEGRPQGAWNFKNSFPNLPDGVGLESFFYKLAVTGPEFTLSTIEGPSNDEDANDKVILKFSGNVSATEGPLKFINILPHTLETEGKIQLRKDTFPLIDLAVDIPFTFDIGNIHMEKVQLKLQTMDLGGGSGMSSIGLAGTIKIGDKTPVIVTLSAYLSGTDVWVFSVTVDDKKGLLAEGLQQLAALISGSKDDFVLPEQVKEFTKFSLSFLTIGIDATKHSVKFVTIEVSNPNKWNTPIPHLAVDKIKAGWTFVRDAEGFKLWEAYVSGDVDIDGVTLGANAELAFDGEKRDLKITANLVDGEIDFENVLKHYTGITGNLPDLKVTAFDVTAFPLKSEYSVHLETENNWPIGGPIADLELNTISMNITYDPNSLYGIIDAQVTIADTPFDVTAEKLKSDTGWVFALSMAEGESITVEDLAKSVLGGMTAPDFLKGIDITKLSASIETETSESTTEVKAYSFQTEIGWDLSKTPSEIPATIDAGVNLDAQKKDTDNGYNYSGSVEGDLKMHNLDMSVCYQFAPSNKTITFSTTYKGLTLTAELIRKKENEKIEKILKFEFPNLTLGEVVEYLVDLAAPGRHVTLGKPWDVLNQINFENLSLAVNLTEKEVTIDYTKKIDLVFIDIESIGFTYKKRGSVDIRFTGKFLDQEYGKDGRPPLQWDIINDVPPRTPGKGKELLDLRYAGLGQHVALTDTTKLNTVSDVITALEKSLVPVTDSKNPLSGATGLKFDADSNLLFGLEVTVIETLKLSAVFDDPYVYGLLVSLSGPSAGSFSGLQFEILYKKVTDNIGVYKTELKLPDQFRHLEFGEVSLTLPVIKVDVYTNGNFRVDMGFPEHGNFADSFCLEVFPFIGYGGFYFAYLTGATSSTVPKITNGVFNPVIELGIGLSVGVGKTIKEGPLSAGFYITVEGITEGTLAWFNPNDKALDRALYYRVQGTIGIIGKLYGAVDFKVIKVSVTIEASAVAIFIIEVYEPIHIALVLHVEAKASVKVLFVKVHFSFGLTLRASFTIGHASNPPWIRDTSSPEALLLRMQRDYDRRLPLDTLLARTVGTAGARITDTDLDWTPVLVFDSQKTVGMRLLPAFTVATPGPPKGDPGAQKIPLMLFVENSILPEASGRSILSVSADHCSTANDPSEVPFNLLAEGMLAWSIHALKKTLEGNIEITELKDLYNNLDDPTTRETGFSYENLVKFIEKNYTFLICGIPVFLEEANTTSSTVFPMIPELSFTTTDNISRDFKKYNEVDQTYEDCLDKYFKQLLVEYEENTAKDPFKKEKTEFSVQNNKESMATVIFRDYFLMVARSAVQSAIDVLESFTYPVQQNDSLSSIAEKFPKLTAEYVVHRGESPDIIRGEFGMTAKEFGELNLDLHMSEDFSEPLEPGKVIKVALGVSAESIAEANQKVPLHDGTDLHISGIRYQVKAGECLTDIAGRFEIDVSSIFSDSQGNPTVNAANPILQPGAQFTVPQFTYESQDGDTLDFVAAFFYARNGFTVSEEEKDAFSNCLAWYAQTIADLNPVVKPGTELKIPSAFHDSEKVTHYTVRDNDTLEFIACYYLLMQIPDNMLQNLKKSFEEFKGKIKDPPKEYTIPEMIRTIHSNDTFLFISTLFPIAIKDLVAANAGKKELLIPLSVLQIPEITHNIKGDTLASLANTYNMTVGELASKIYKTPDIFDVGEKIEIIDVPKYSIKNLIEEVVKQGECNRIASMVSRFLINGLRVPDPTDPAFLKWCQDQMVNPQNGDTITLDSLYKLTGQQIPTPTPTDLPYDIIFTKDESVTWIAFGVSAVIRKSDTAEALKSQYSRIEELNPATDFEQLTPGSIVVTDEIDELPIYLDKEIVDENRPSAVFDPETVVGPKALPLYRLSPVKYGLQNCIHWQASESIWNAGDTNADTQPKAGEPTVWLFSDSLMNKAKTEGTQAKFGLFSVVHNNHGEPTPVAQYTWAAIVEIKVRRIKEPEGTKMLPDSYELLGADQDDRNLLLEIWEYLEKNEESAKLYLLYRPNADSGNPRGLASDALDEMNTFLLKTNVSTLTTSGAKAARGLAATEDTGLYAASIEDAEDFIKLLWEGSITGTGGYYLHYKTKSGERTGLPEQVFAEESVGTLHLVVVLDSQIQEKYPCSLVSFNNCAVVGDNIDPSSTSVCAEITNKNDQVKLPSIPSGNVGFEWIRLSPEHEPDTPEQRTRQLYQLLGYKISEGAKDNTDNTTDCDTEPEDLSDVSNSDGFQKSNEGLPVGPAESEIPGSLEKVSVGSAEVVWGTSKNAVFYWDCFSFQIDSQALPLKDVSAGSDGSVWGIGTDNKIKRKDQDGWSDIPGSLSHIAVGDKEHVWGLDGNTVYQWDSKNNKFTKVPCIQLKDISAGSDGSVWGIGTDNKIKRKDQDGWSDIPGSLSQIAVGDKEHVWGLNGNTLYQWDSTNNKFTKVPSIQLKDVSAGSDGSVWGIDTDNKIQRVNNWYFHQIIPVAAFAKQHNLPDCTALPDYEKDPYAGIGKNPQTGKLFDVPLELEFGDVFGNRAEESKQLAIPVGYIDKIIGLSQWPGTTSSYLFDTVNSSPALHVDISLKIPDYIPGTNYEKALCTASAHLERFKQVYYQISQKHVTFALTTSMNQKPHNPPHEYELTPVEERSLINFVSASYIFLNTVLCLKQVTHTIDPKNITLSDIVEYVYKFSVSISDIGLANKDRETRYIFSGDIEIPLYYMIRTGDTLDSIATSQKITVENLAENNKNVPLNPAVPITLPKTRTTKATSSDSLKSLAVANFCTVNNIADENAPRNDILKEGAQFTVGSITVVVKKKDSGTDSFNDLVEKFKKQKLTVTVSDIAVANELKPVFNDGVTLNISDYVIQEGDTLGSVAKEFGVSVAQLAESAKECPNVFACGTPLYVKPDSTVSPSVQTLSEIAQTYRISVEQLVSHNGGTSLVIGKNLIIPNMVYIDQSNTCYVPYTAGDDSLQGIATKFGMHLKNPNDPNSLANLNKNLPYIFYGDKTFPVGSTEVTTRDDDSMASLCDRYSITLEQLVNAVNGKPGLIRKDALFVCLLPSTADSSADDFTTLKHLEDKYNVDPESIAQANASLQGFLASGKTVTVKTQSLTTNENETFNTLVTRFSREKKIETTPAEIALANENAPLIKIAKAQKFILPPTPVALTKDMADNTYPGTIFELKTDFVISREKDLVDINFQDTEEFWQNSSLIAPKAEAADNGALSLKAFASSFEEAFPKCKVAVGKTKSDEGIRTRHVWVLAFDISQVDIGKNPVCFGVKPLSNKLRYVTGVSIESFDSTTGNLKDPKLLDFQAIDMEVWARKFLNAVELFLSPEYAVPAYQFNADAFEGVVDAKKTLARNISEGLDYILENESGDKSTAQETLKQHLMINLAKAYETDAVIQYPVSVTSPFKEPDTAPRLSGKPVPTGTNGKKYSISSAKTSLYNGNSTVNFLFKVKKEADYRSLSLDMNYVISELEYDIQNVQHVEGYQSSSWLSFIRPIGKSQTEISINTLPKAVVPIPLRFYPEPPSLILQSGTPFKEQPQTVDDAKKWDYAFIYEHKDAAQDTVYLDTTFNKEYPKELAEGSDLFDALAQFIAVYPQIKTKLAELLNSDSINDNKQVLIETLHTFAGLVSDVADAWKYTDSSYTAEKDSSGIPFSYKTQIVDKEGYLSELILYLLSDPVDPPIFDEQFPDIYWIDKKSGEKKLSKSVDPDKKKCQYSFEGIAKVPAYTSQQYKLEFDDLNIVTIQNALSSAYVTRNETLIEDKPTAPYFVYRTPLTSFSNILTPFISVDNLIPFGTGKNFKTALKTLFNEQILDTEGEQEIKVSVQYGYELVSSQGKKPIISLLPVCFKPRFTYYKGFPGDLYDYITDWEKGKTIARKEGMYVLDVGVFSSLSGELLYPLLELKKLGYQISETP